MKSRRGSSKFIYIFTQEFTMKRLYITLSLLFIFPSILFAQEEGIKFFSGTFEEALAEAKKQDKPLFVDFYAVWCGPCKRIAREIFPLKEVGDYFNEKFINLQLDAEAPENVEIAKKYKVSAFPTLGFISNDGTPISITVGGVDKSTLLENAKIAVGESIGFEGLYEMYKKDKGNLSIQQDLLTQAPSFLGAQDGMDAERWVVRIQKLYRDYITAKMGDALINRQDYIIINNLGVDDKKLEAQVVDFMNANLSKWQEAVGDVVAYYIIEYNDKQMTALAKAGDIKYKELLEKINTEYKDAYAVVPDRGITPYDKSRMYYDGLYSLYEKKDAAAYIELMRQYFEKLGANALGVDYGQAAQDLYYAMGDKLKAPEHETAIEWLKKALEAENNLTDRINFLVMIGDSYKALKKYDDAQALYNQAFAESYRLQDNQMLQEMVQGTILRKAAELELMRK